MAKVGRPKGAVSRRTRQWAVLEQYITELAVPKLMEELDKLSGTDYINMIVKLLAFFKPTQQSIAANVDNGGITVNVITDKQDLLNNI